MGDSLPSAEASGARQGGEEPGAQPGCGSGAEAKGWHEDGEKQRAGAHLCS